MNEQHINYDTAILAREKGFNEYVSWYYHPKIFIKNEKPLLIADGANDDNGIYFNGFNDDNSLNIWKPHSYNTTTNHYAAAPTQSQLQKWLRDNHNLHPHICLLLEERIWNADIYDLTKSECYDLLNDPMSLQAKSYEEVLEIALQEMLKKIKYSKNEI